MVRAGLIVALSLLAATPALAAENKNDAAEAIRAAARFVKPVMGEDCDYGGILEGAGTDRSARFDIPYRYAGQDQDSPDRHYHLTQLYCFSGAYNEVFVYVGQDGDDAPMQLLSFAEPVLDYDYIDEEFTRLKAPPRVTGFKSGMTMVNASYDAETKTIYTGAKWRGIGDAWSAGEWRFEEGTFVLDKFEVDPTYDANADEPPKDEPESYQVYPLK